MKNLARKFRRLFALSGVSRPNRPDEGRSRGEHSRSQRDHHDSLQDGTTHPSCGVSHGGMCPQALHSSSLQPGTPAGCDTAPHASRPRPSTEFADGFSYPLGFVRPQSQGQLDSAWPSSEGSASAGAWDLWAGSHRDPHQSLTTSEPHSSYHPDGFGVICQPIAAAPPPQGPAGGQGAWVPFS